MKEPYHEELGDGIWMEAERVEGEPARVREREPEKF